VALADSTKWNKVSLAYFWPLEKVAAIVTEGRIPREMRESLQACGVELLFAAQA
jgi:DeoR/GlpR family transcriptional regulator of sugar metabolism